MVPGQFSVYENSLKKTACNSSKKNNPNVANKMKTCILLQQEKRDKNIVKYYNIQAVIHVDFENYRQPAMSLLKKKNSDKQSLDEDSIFRAKKVTEIRD